jgi:hypothetical protein
MVLCLENEVRESIELIKILDEHLKELLQVVPVSDIEMQNRWSYLHQSAIISLESVHDELRLFAGGHDRHWRDTETGKVCEQKISQLGDVLLQLKAVTMEPLNPSVGM